MSWLTHRHLSSWMIELTFQLISSMSWISCTHKLDELDKLYCKFDELAKLRMSSMSWISCTVSSMSWLSCPTYSGSSISWLSWNVTTDKLDELDKYCKDGSKLRC